jgi:uncharacterized protein (DUF2236 family)
MSNYLAFGEYGPGSEAWRLNREATALLAAAPRALLMQIAHPLVAEGVEQHSRFRTRPRARLEGTLHSYMRIVFGSPSVGGAEIDRLNHLHEHIRGLVRDPTAASLGHESYAARDPELALWVHATLIDSTIVAYDAWIEPLAPERTARFYRETLPVGRAFGIPESLLPPDLDSFNRYVARMLGPDGPIRVTPTARSQAETILHPALGTFLLGREEGAVQDGRGAAASVASVLDRIPPASYDWLMWPGLRLLPPELKAGYGIPDTPARRAVSDWLVAGFRFWRPLVPARVRSMPAALAADRRIERAGEPGDRKPMP